MPFFIGYISFSFGSDDAGCCRKNNDCGNEGNCAGGGVFFFAFAFKIDDDGVAAAIGLCKRRLGNSCAFTAVVDVTDDSAAGDRVVIRIGAVIDIVVIGVVVDIVVIGVAVWINDRGVVVIIVQIVAGINIACKSGDAYGKHQYCGKKNAKDFFPLESVGSS